MPTRIVALRHGKPESEGYADDALQPLSEEGIEAQKRITTKLQSMGICPTMILSSPLERALQSAQIAEEVFGIPVEEEPALGNDFDEQRILGRLPSPDQNATIFLVGHAPTLANFINDVVGKNVLPTGLSKSSAAIVDFPDCIAFGSGTFIDYLLN